MMYCSLPDCACVGDGRAEISGQLWKKIGDVDNMASVLQISAGRCRKQLHNMAAGCGYLSNSIRTCHYRPLHKAFNAHHAHSLQQASFLFVCLQLCFRISRS